MQLAADPELDPVERLAVGDGDSGARLDGAGGGQGGLRQRQAHREALRSGVERRLVARQLGAAGIERDCRDPVQPGARPEVQLDGPRRTAPGHHAAAVELEADAVHPVPPHVGVETDLAGQQLADRCEEADG